MHVSAVLASVHEVAAKACSPHIDLSRAWAVKCPLLLTAASSEECMREVGRTTRV